MSSEQRGQQLQTTEQQEQEQSSRAELVRRGALAAIGGAVSGTARALWTHVLGDDV